MGLYKIRNHFARRNTATKIRQWVEHHAKSSNPLLLNLGCGGRYHPEWCNIDAAGDGDTVFSWNLLDELPLPDSCCDVIYSSHTLEHFDRPGSRKFLAMCRRLLKADGILRIAVPDLEGIVRSYLNCLEKALAGDSSAIAAYEWSVIELLDQLVRHRSGGEMLVHWMQATVPAEDFIIARVGSEYLQVRENLRKQHPPTARTPSAVEVGHFRLGGEIHQWMYDRYSLKVLLMESGFTKVRACRADESAIPGFSRYCLDVNNDGSIYKPDSIYLEAIAPR